MPSYQTSSSPGRSGAAGEELVARWLQQQGWEVLHRRWRCRWGELDIVARRDRDLAFVEVKTRSRGNWDRGGLDAIDGKKQEKTILAARSFLGATPELAECCCRFDVAIVANLGRDRASTPPTIALGEPIPLCGYRLVLKDYIESAFS